MLPIRNGDLIFLTDASTMTMLGQSIIIGVDQTIPTITHDASVGYPLRLVISSSDPLKIGDPVRITDSFTMATIDNKSTGIYLSVHNDQPVYSVKHNKYASTQWQFQGVSADNYVYYGVPYSLVNIRDQVCLTHDGKTLDVTRVLPYPTQWTATMVNSMYTCQPLFGTCSESHGLGNLALGITWKSPGSRGTPGYMDRYGRHVYVSLDECTRACQRRDESSELTSGLSLEPPQVPSDLTVQSGQSKQSGTIVIAMIWGILLGYIAYRSYRSR